MVAHGFISSVGLHHNNQRNEFNLIDDLIEPFRPMVDLQMLEIALVDLPSETRRERKIKREYENHLFRQGFSPLQQGVYTRLASSRDEAAARQSRLLQSNPETGVVRLLVLTERQFANSVLAAGTPTPQECEVGAQLDIFL